LRAKRSPFQSGSILYAAARSFSSPLFRLGPFLRTTPNRFPSLYLRFLSLPSTRQYTSRSSLSGDDHERHFFLLGRWPLVTYGRSFARAFLLPSRYFPPVGHVSFRGSPMNRKMIFSRARENPAPLCPKRLSCFSVLFSFSHSEPGARGLLGTTSFSPVLPGQLAYLPCGDLKPTPPRARDPSNAEAYSVL